MTTTATATPDGPVIPVSQLDIPPGMQPLRVIADMPAGIACASPWGIALDGLLAATLHTRAKHLLTDEQQATRIPVMQQPAPADLPLPLARCGEPQALTDGDGLWHWAATCGFPLDDDGDAPDVQYWMSRTDQREIVQAADDAPANLSDGSGRYRRHHMPLLVSVCTRVEWRAVGNLEAISELLTPLWSIGKKRAAGAGRVTSWHVLPAPELTPAAAAHLHPDGTLGRPTPAACLTGLPVPAAAKRAGHDGAEVLAFDGGTGLAGLRPPYIHPARQHRLHLPALLS